MLQFEIYFLSTAWLLLLNWYCVPILCVFPKIYHHFPGYHTEAISYSYPSDLKRRHNLKLSDTTGVDPSNKAGFTIINLF